MRKWGWRGRDGCASYGRGSETEPSRGFRARGRGRPARRAPLRGPLHQAIPNIDVRKFRTVLLKTNSLSGDGPNIVFGIADLVSDADVSGHVCPEKWGSLVENKPVIGLGPDIHVRKSASSGLIRSREPSPSHRVCHALREARRGGLVCGRYVVELDGVGGAEKIIELSECFRFARFRGARKPVSRYGLFAAESSKPRVELNRRLRPAL